MLGAFLIYATCFNPIWSKECWKLVPTVKSMTCLSLVYRKSHGMQDAFIGDNPLVTGRWSMMGRQAATSCFNSLPFMLPVSAWASNSRTNLFCFLELPAPWSRGSFQACGHAVPLWHLSYLRICRRGTDLGWSFCLSWKYNYPPTAWEAVSATQPRHCWVADL